MKLHVKVHGKIFEVDTQRILKALTGGFIVWIYLYAIFYELHHTIGIEGGFEYVLTGMVYGIFIGPSLFLGPTFSLFILRKNKDKLNAFLAGLLPNMIPGCWIFWFIAKNFFDWRYSGDPTTTAIEMISGCIIGSLVYAPIMKFLIDFAFNIRKKSEEKNIVEPQNLLT